MTVMVVVVTILTIKVMMTATTWDDDCNDNTDGTFHDLPALNTEMIVWVCPQIRKASPSAAFSTSHQRADNRRDLFQENHRQHPYWASTCGHIQVQGPLNYQRLRLFPLPWISSFAVPLSTDRWTCFVSTYCSCLVCSYRSCFRGSYWFCFKCRYDPALRSNVSSGKGSLSSSGLRGLQFLFSQIGKIWLTAFVT